MKRETIGKLWALKGDLKNDRDGCLDPEYPGTSAEAVNRRLDELIDILLSDEEDE